MGVVRGAAGRGAREHEDHQQPAHFPTPRRPRPPTPCTLPCARHVAPYRADKAAPPVVTTSGDVTVIATSEAGAAATFTATAKDPADGNTQTYCLPRSGSTFPIGKTMVSCWAVNKVGKMGRAALTVTVNRPQF